MLKSTPDVPPEVSVIVATFGSDEWMERGYEKSLETFYTQTWQPEVISVHGETLATARNAGARYATTEWLVFLDADDRLDPRYCGVVGDRGDVAEEDEHGKITILWGDADVLQPSVRGFRGDKMIEDAPVFTPKQHPLIRSNYLTIGSPIRNSLFSLVGGFDEWPCLEDWALWLKCEKAGAKFGECRDAIYLINDEHDRNITDQFEVAQQIRVKYR